MSIWDSCLKLLRVTFSSCLLHFFLYLFWSDSCLELTLVSFSISISTFFYHACMFNSQRICARVVLIVGSTRRVVKTCWGVGMYRAESSTSFMTYFGMRKSLSSRNGLTEEYCNFVDIWSTREESSTSFMVCWGLWGRIFYFLIGDIFGVVDSLGKN